MQMAKCHRNAVRENADGETPPHCGATRYATALRSSDAAELEKMQMANHHSNWLHYNMPPQWHHQSLWGGSGFSTNYY